MKFVRKQPKNLDLHLFKKYQRRLLKNSSYNRSRQASSLRMGTIGVKVLENCFIQHYQLESLRKFFLPFTRALSRIWFFGSFTTALTKKPLGVRMGKGKGKLDKWVTFYRKGDLFLEFELFNENLNIVKVCSALRYKLPFKFCFITNKNVTSA